MTQSQRIHHSRRYREHARRPTPTPTTPTQPRQSPLTDIRTLTRLVFESYQTSFECSSPKVQRRYKRLIQDLAAYQQPP